MFFGPWPAITGRALARERNLLLAALVLLLGTNLVLGTTFHYGLHWEKYGGYGGLALLAAKLIYMEVVYRVSKVLRQPLWMTVPYVVLAAIAGFELIPFAGLLVGIRMARGTLDER
ncbi:MAG TPA: hypothetical protein VI007_10495 [bacterium]